MSFSHDIGIFYSDEAKEGLEETSASAPRQERVIPAAQSPPPPPPPDRDDVLEKLKHLSAISASARAALLRSDEVFTHNLDALQLPEEDEQPEPVPLSVQKPKSSLFGAWGDSIKTKSIADKAGDAADEKDGKGTHTEDLTVSASITADKKDGKGTEDQAAIDDADTAANLKLIAEQKAADDAARAAWEQAKKNYKFWEVRPAKQYYYKFPAGMSATEQAQQQKGLVIAYSVGTSVEYFACVDSQYWSNLGLNLTAGEWVLTTMVPPAICLVLGPGRRLQQDPLGNFIVLANSINARSCLVAIETTPAGASERTFALSFLVEADIDAVATKEDQSEHRGRARDSFLQECVYPLLEPHIQAANGRLPKDEPLPPIPRYPATVHRPERIQQSGVSNSSLSVIENDAKFIMRRDSIASRKVRRKSVLPKGELVPINGARYGDIGLREGEELGGFGRELLLQFWGDCYDEKVDPAGFSAVLASPGDSTLKIGGKLWCFTKAHRKEVAEDRSQPPCNAGALINHAPEGSGANCTWILPKGKRNQYPILKMTDNLVYGGFFLFDYDGQKGSVYWPQHVGGVTPRDMPLAADADRKLIWPRFNKPSPAPQNFKLPAKKTAAGKKVGVGGKGGNQTHLPTCLCPTCPLGIKKRAKARAKLVAANNTEARAQEETDEEDSDDESEDSDDESEDSPLQSPKKKKVKRGTAKESGSKRPDGQTPIQGGGDRQVCAPGCRCPRCRQSQRVPGHGEGCDCTGCVPHGKGCKCEECVPDAKHGKGCRCKEKCAPLSSPPHVVPFAIPPSSPPDQHGGYGGQQPALSPVFQPAAGGGRGGKSLAAYLAYSQQQATSYLSHSQQQSTSFLNYMAGGNSRLEIRTCPPDVGITGGVARFASFCYLIRGYTAWGSGLYRQAHSSMEYNKGAIDLATTNIYRQKLDHIDLRYEYVNAMILAGKAMLEKIGSADNYGAEGEWRVEGQVQRWAARPRKARRSCYTGRASHSIRQGPTAFLTASSPLAGVRMHDPHDRQATTRGRQ
eukprot:g67435.t1